MKLLDRVITKSIGTTAEEIDLHGLTAVISNNSANTVYFKDAESGECTAANGFPIPKNTVLQVPFAATKISMIASGAGSSVSILILDNY